MGCPTFIPKAAPSLGRSPPLSVYLFVCLFVCLSGHITRNRVAELHKVFVHVAYGRGSDGVAKRYELRHVFIPWGQPASEPESSTTLCLEGVRQVAVAY